MVPKSEKCLNLLKKGIFVEPSGNVGTKILELECKNTTVDTISGGDLTGDDMKLQIILTCTANQAM